MSIVKNKDKRTGITYVYESESYWDKEKQQPRSRRTLIGKLDEETGEIIPTDGRGRKRKVRDNKTGEETTLASENGELKKLLEDKQLLITQLQAENQKLRADKDRILKQLRSITEQY